MRKPWHSKGTDQYGALTGSRPTRNALWCRSRVIVGLLAWGLAPSAVADTPPVPSSPAPTCTYVGGKCFVSGAFTLSTHSAGAHHYRVCRSNDTTGWGGCDVVMSFNTGSTFTVSGSNLPSDGFRRAYRFSACDSSNNCTAWADNSEAYVTMDLTGPTAPGNTSVACTHVNGGDCWVKDDFVVATQLPTDGGSGIGGLDVCRSNDTSGWGGCNVWLANYVPPFLILSIGGTSYVSHPVSGSHLPADGYRRAYYFRAKDRVGNLGAWNSPRYVRVDRHNPTVWATNSSTQWVGSRTATISAADATNGTGANSGLAGIRYRWNVGLDSACIYAGSPTSAGAVLTVPAGDNTLYLCARDNTGRVATWTGTYRVDATRPSLDSLSVSSSAWWIGDGSVYQITARASDSGAGVRELRALINYQGSNSGNPRGNFSWRDQSLGYLWPADQVPCTGGGFASKRHDAFNPGTITLTGCSTSVSGSQRTVTFTVRPEASFGNFGAINDVSFWARDFALNARGWQHYDLNFSSRAPSDFSLNFVAQQDLDLSTRAVEPAGTASLAVRLTRSDGRTDPATLSVTGLPPEISSTHPSQLYPGQSATIQLTASAGAADAKHSFEVVGTDAGGSASTTGSLIVADLPNVASVSPERVPAGQTSNIVIQGNDFENALVWVATEKPYPEAPDRVFPLVSVLSTNSTGTRLTVEVDATGPGVEGYYNLIIENTSGGAPVPIEVVPRRPVIYTYTPAQPSESDLYVFAALGANLAGATLSSTDPAHVVFHEVDNVSDSELIGFVEILPGAAASADIVVANATGQASLPITVLGSPSESNTHNIVAGSTVQDPGILMQELAASHSDFDFPFGPGPGPHIEPTFSFRCGGTFRESERIRFAYRLSDILGRTGREVLDNLKALPLGERYDFDLEIVEALAELEVSIDFICVATRERGLRFTDLSICIKSSLRLEVIGVDAFECRLDSCGGENGCTPDFARGDLASFSLDNLTECTEPTDLTPPGGLGERAVAVEQEACCQDTLTPTASGTDSRGSAFNLALDPIETDVDEATCSEPDQIVEYAAVMWIDQTPMIEREAELRPHISGWLAEVTTPGDAVGCAFLQAALLAQAFTGISGELTDVDRQYLNNWVFTRAGDPPPPTTFGEAQRCDAQMPTLEKFKSCRHYRVMSHAKFRYGGGRVEFAEPPDTRTGLTAEPCLGLRLGEPMRHPDDGMHSPALNGQAAGHAYVLNSARVGEEGQKLDQLLNCCAGSSDPNCEPFENCSHGETTPWIWSVLRVNSSGELEPSPIDVSIFGTLNVYRDGSIIHRVPQSDVECFLAQDDSYARRAGEIPAMTPVACADQQETTFNTIGQAAAPSDDDPIAVRAELADLTARFEAAPTEQEKKTLAGKALRQAQATGITLDSDVLYYLTASATEALITDVPFPIAFDTEGHAILGQPNPELVTWASANGITFDEAAHIAIYDQPVDIARLLGSDDSLVIELFQDALDARNYVVTLIGAAGLRAAAHTDSIPQIQETAEGVPTDVALALADELERFGTLEATTAAEEIRALHSGE